MAVYCEMRCRIGPQVPNPWTLGVVRRSPLRAPKVLCGLGVPARHRAVFWAPSMRILQELALDQTEDIALDHAFMQASVRSLAHYA